MFTPTSGSETHKACYSPTTAQTLHPLGAGSSCHGVDSRGEFLGRGPHTKGLRGELLKSCHLENQEG